jgi:hypothetical protein
MKAFLLRFEESIKERSTAAVSRLFSSGASDGGANNLSVQAGTQTLTEVAQESADRDPRSMAYSVFPDK